MHQALDLRQSAPLVEPLPQRGRRPQILLDLADDLLELLPPTLVGWRESGYGDAHAMAIAACP